MEPLQLEGGAALAAALQDFVEQFGGNETRLLRALGVGLVEVTKDHFKAEADPQGQPWPKSRRVLEGQKGKTLQDSRILYNSLSWHIGPTGDLEVGSPLEYARIHNEGGTIRPRKDSGKKALHFGGVIRASVTIPKRQYLGWGPAESAQVRGDLSALAKSLSKGGK